MVDQLESSCDYRLDTSLNSLLQLAKVAPKKEDVSNISYSAGLEFKVQGHRVAINMHRMLHSPVR